MSRQRPAGVDPVVVDRIMAGPYDVPSTNRAERVEVVRRWREAGRDLAELERITGWRAARYYDTKAAL